MFFAEFEESSSSKDLPCLSRKTGNQYYCLMSDGFVLSVPYKGNVHEFNTRLVGLGYIYQFHTIIEGRTLIFERDEERNYRVIDTSNSGNTIDGKLIEAVIGRLLALQSE
jgi:hypothetical protein